MLTRRLRTSKEPTLNGISLSIKAGQRLGICGRSGGGKSSLVSTLLRLLDLSSGSIYIDGVDIATIPRQTVRSRLIALPQEPYLLAGSLRYNVDPLEACSSEEIEQALRKVHLYHLAKGDDGLDVTLAPEMLSHGQCQLLCLARAMLRKGSILVLDEATASVDVETDSLMQHLIRSEFSTHTVIAVAHRLDTIIDFDAVAVMDRGHIAEYGHPDELLKRGGTFRELYRVQKGDRRSWRDSILSQLTSVGVSPASPLPPPLPSLPS